MFRDVRVLLALVGIALGGGLLVLVLGVVSTYVQDERFFSRLSAIGPIVNASLLAGFIAVTWLYTMSTRRIAEATELQARALSQPILVPARRYSSTSYFSGAPWLTELAFEITNVGTGPAVNVAITMEAGNGSPVQLFRAYGWEVVAERDDGTPIEEPRWSHEPLPEGMTYAINPGEHVIVGIKPSQSPEENPGLVIPTSSSGVQRVARLTVRFGDVHGGKFELNRDLSVVGGRDRFGGQVFEGDYIQRRLA